MGALVPAASFGASVGGDFDGDGKTDIAVWRPSDGSWSVRDQWVVPHYGVGGDVPVAGDFNGDRKADVAVFRPADGSWSIMNQRTAYLGQSGDIPVPGDYDGDGKTDVAVWRPADGTWRIEGKPTVIYGVAGDIPVPADFNGDGKVDIAVWRPSDGSWSIMNQGTVPHYGMAGDIPVPGDFNGDGKADIAVWRPSDGTWNIQGQLTLAYGVAGDVPVPGDFNGDGKSDIAVWRPTDGSWSIYAQGTGWYGVAGDIPLGSTLARVNLPKMAAGDFSGDGLTDFGMWRPLEGAWSIRSVFALAYGQPGDRAVPADYNGDGRLDVAVFRRLDHSWSINAQRIAYSLTGDIAVPADYDTDGKADVATFRPSDGAWIIENQPTVFYGAPGDYPVPADYNADRRIDIAVFRPSDHSWSIRGQRVAYNLIGDIPVPGDYNGDGKTDVALYRKSDGAWVIENQPTVFYGGQSGDIPAPGDYNGDGKTDIAIYRPSDNSWSIYGQFTDHYGQALDQPLVSKFADTAPPTAKVTGGIYDARTQPAMTNGEISVAGIDDLSGVTQISVIGQKADGITGQITGTSRSCAAPLCTPYGLDLSTVIDPAALNWQTGTRHLSVQLTDNAGNATTVASWDVQYYKTSWTYGGTNRTVDTDTEINNVLTALSGASDAQWQILWAGLSSAEQNAIDARYYNPVATDENVFSIPFYEDPPGATASSAPSPAWCGVGANHDVDLFASILFVDFFGSVGCATLGSNTFTYQVRATLNDVATGATLKETPAGGGWSTGTGGTSVLHTPKETWSINDSGRARRKRVSVRTMAYITLPGTNTRWGIIPPGCGLVRPGPGNQIYCDGDTKQFYVKP